MANNRMYLQCLCGEQQYLAKYFSSQGWYFTSTKTPEEFGAAFQIFLDEHEECGIGYNGRQYEVTYEDEGQEQ